ncbi:MAG: type IV pilus modification protein PilV [Granulosicoccus sp.]
MMKGKSKSDSAIAGRISGKQAGLGIVEVLVALVIVSFGVLGMAGLQLTGLKHSTSGFNRSKALMLADGMATRMRINRDAARAQAYNNYDSALLNCFEKPDPYCQATVSASAQACDSLELASFDRYTLACGDYGSTAANAGVAGLLPAGSSMKVSCVDTVCVPESTYRITVSWPERANASDDDQQMRQVQMRLRP